MPARIFDTVAGLVRELAEVHLPGVAGQAEHEDVRARTEDPLLHAGNDDGAHFRMLEADPVQGIAELDIDPEIVGIELQLVAGDQAAFLGHVHGQTRD